MEEGLEKKYGKPLAHWVSILKETGIEKHKAMIDYLKSEHGFTYGFANFVAHKTRKSDAASQDHDVLIQEQYKGKETLLPMFDKLHQFCLDLGNDITVTPRKAAVSMIRKRQFALIKPATKTRIDLGLKIKDQTNEGKLEGSGPFGTMCTHRIKLSHLTDIDMEVEKWILKAYEQSV